jgi:hypothetical protein
MSKKVLTSTTFKLLVPSGKATPSPPVGPALGQRGVKSIDFWYVSVAFSQIGSPLIWNYRSGESMNLN